MEISDRPVIVNEHRGAAKSVKIAGRRIIARSLKTFSKPDSSATG